LIDDVLPVFDKVKVKDVFDPKSETKSQAFCCVLMKSLLCIFLVIVSCHLTLSADEKLPRVDTSIEAPLFQLRPAIIETIRTTGSGRVADMSVRLGDKVQAGEMLLRLQVDRLDTELRRALTNYNNIRSQYTAAEQGADAEKIASVTQLSLAAESELREIAERFRNLAITSPFTGIADRIHILEKELVKAGQPALRIIQTSYMQLRVPVDSTSISPGQQVPVLLGKGRIAGTVVELLPPGKDAAQFRPLLDHLAIAVIAIDNRDELLVDGELAFLPISPMAIVPEEFALALNRFDPQVNLQAAEGEVTSIPISILGDVGQQKTLIVGAFREGDKIVERSDENLEDGSPNWLPIGGTILFSNGDTIFTPKQFVSAMPALAESRADITPTSMSNTKEQFSTSITFQRPALLDSLLLPNEYPLCLTDTSLLSQIFGIEKVDLAFFRQVNSYYVQEAIQKRLALKRIDDLKLATPDGKLSDYLRAVESLNQDYLLAISPIRTTRSPQAQLTALFSGFGYQLIFTPQGQNILAVTPEQAQQLKQTRNLLIDQREEVIQKYFQSSGSSDQLLERTTQILSAWKEDLSIMLTESQRDQIAKLKLNSDSSSENMVTKNETTKANSGVATEESEEQPRIKMPEALKGKSESTMLPFLILGAGVAIVMAAMIVGYILYRRKRSP